MVKDRSDVMTMLERLPENFTSSTEHYSEFLSEQNYCTKQPTVFWLRPGCQHSGRKQAIAQAQYRSNKKW